MASLTLRVSTSILSFSLVFLSLVSCAKSKEKQTCYNFNNTKICTGKKYTTGSTTKKGEITLVYQIYTPAPQDPETTAFKFYGRISKDKCILVDKAAPVNFRLWPNDKLKEVKLSDCPEPKL